MPLVFIHGHLQFARTWETTADGREGFQELFLRRRFATCLVDLPRLGRAGQSTEPMAVAELGELPCAAPTLINDTCCAAASHGASRQVAGEAWHFRAWPLSG
jgi:pimeloyl-ACP methyl ester carboxylesterase